MNRLEQIVMNYKAELLESLDHGLTNKLFSKAESYYKHEEMRNYQLSSFKNRDYQLVYLTSKDKYSDFGIERYNYDGGSIVLRANCHFKDCKLQHYRNSRTHIVQKYYYGPERTFAPLAVELFFVEHYHGLDNFFVKLSYHNIDNQKHRLDGPAIVIYNISENRPLQLKYYINDIEISPEKVNKWMKLNNIPPDTYELSKTQAILFQLQLG